MKKKWKIGLTVLALSVLVYFTYIYFSYEHFAKKMLRTPISYIEVQPWYDDPIIQIREEQEIKKLREWLIREVRPLPIATLPSPDLPLILHMKDGSVIQISISSPRHGPTDPPNGVVLNWNGFFRVGPNCFPCYVKRK